MAIVENLISIRKRPEYKANKSFANHRSLGYLTPVMNSLETLKTTLEKRYDEHNATLASKVNTNSDKGAKVTTEEPIAMKESLLSLIPTTKDIKCVEIMKILREGSDDIRKQKKFVLFIDIRPSDEFLKNRIQFDEKFAQKYMKPKVTHVEVSYAKPGLVASKITTGSKAQDGFTDRHNAVLGKQCSLSSNIIQSKYL